MSQNQKLLVAVSVALGITSRGDDVSMKQRVPSNVDDLLGHAVGLCRKFHVVTGDELVWSNKREQFVVPQVDAPARGENHELLPAELAKISADMKKAVADTRAKYGSARANNQPLPAATTVDTLILHLNSVAWKLAKLKVAIVFFPGESFQWAFDPVDPKTLRCAILKPTVEEVLKDVVCRGYHIVGEATQDLFRDDSVSAHTLVSIDHPLGQITHVMPLSQAHAIKGLRTRVTCRVSGKRGEPARVVGEIVFS